MIYNTRKRDIAKYVLLPQVAPRIRALFTQGFELIPYLIALVYQCVRLLPPTHPYLDQRNIGRFGLRNVVAEAANNLVIKTANIDQILLFIVVLAGIVLAVLQICLVGVALFIQPAMAAMPTSFAGFFLTPQPGQDLAHIMLDLVFGVEGMFNSCLSAPPCKNMDGQALIPQAITGNSVFNLDGAWPFPVHYGLHRLFQIYNLGLLVVAVIITLYFMFTVVAETAQTGTAFGKRFNKVWAPLRIVMAFGLLVPIGSLNSAQYIVLYAAKFGTGFATNGWILFNETLTTSYLGETQALIATPQVPEIGTLLQFIFVARTCDEADYIVRGEKGFIQPYAVKDPLAFGGNSLQIKQDTKYNDLMAFAKGSNLITIRFGIRDEKEYGIYKGNVSPKCGEMHFMVTDSRVPGGTAGEPEGGTKLLQETYFNIIKDLWFKTYGAPGDKSSKPFSYACDDIGVCTETGKPLNNLLTPADASGIQNGFNTQLTKALNDAVKAQESSSRFTVDNNLKEKGWPAAAIWYNRIAEMNGALTTATFKIPMPSRYPEAMEFVRKKIAQYNQEVEPHDRYNPALLTQGNVVHDPDYKNDDVAKALNVAFQHWQRDGVTTSTHTEVSGNIVIDIINIMFGTDGLYNMRKNTGVHPLAQLTSLGKTLVDTAINNIGYAAMGAGTSAILTAFAKFPGVAAQVVIDMVLSFAMISLTAGFILYYIVPFLPFIYFFFAFGGWIKAIFEAMVGTPLWALAHIRIDGEGLPGRAAMGGYFLIFEIFLRPILTIFGFIASITIFAALVETLNEVFTLVTSNVGGYDIKSDLKGTTPSQIGYYRGPVDEFFYTVLYAVIVYMLALSSFKMIDQLPASILRWMGQSVQPFGKEDDAADGLLTNAQQGLNQGLQTAQTGLKQLGGTVANLGGMTR